MFIIVNFTRRRDCIILPTFLHGYYIMGVLRQKCGINPKGISDYPLWDKSLLDNCVVL